MYHQAETVGEMRRFGQIDGSNMETRSKLVKSRVVKHQPPEQEDMLNVLSSLPVMPDVFDSIFGVT